MTITASAPIEPAVPGPQDRRPRLDEILAAAAGPALGVAVFGALLSIADPEVPFWLWRLALSIAAGLTATSTIAYLQLRSRGAATNHPNDSPSDALASGLVSYAHQLARTHRDQALIELRTSTSRLLHLLGANEARQEIGELASEAAGGLGDRITQASILLDDLGWSLHESGQSDKALSNIEEAIEILSEEIGKGGEATETLLELRAKAQRHLAVVRSHALPLSEARALLAPAREDTELLRGHPKKLHQAQLHFSESALILADINRQVGPAGRIDKTGELFNLWQEGMTISDLAMTQYLELNDLERQSKALAQRVDYLGHDSNKARLREAQAQLDRITAQVARTFKALAN